MLKIGTEYLDCNDTVEIERQVKLFEDLSSTDGDYSYQFNLPKTAKNIKALGNPFPDNYTKPVYQKINCEIVDNGLKIYSGFLRIEKITDVFQVAFYSGNNNWFGMLSDKMTAIDWSEFDVDQTEANLSLAISNTSGTVFPLVDNGLLAYRSEALLKVEDFVGAIYTKDIMRKVFQEHNIKIQGELLDDPDYSSSVVLSNAKSTADIEARTTKTHTTNSPNPHDSSYHKMVWTDDTNYPYFDGSANLFDLSLGRYTADVKMRVKVNLNITQDSGSAGLGIVFKMAIYINGVLFEEKTGPFGTSAAQSYTKVVTLEAGDYLEIFTYNAAAFWDDPITDATLEITPTFIYKAIGSAMVPNWTQAEFIGEIFRQYNVLSHYEPESKTLTANLFEKLKDKEPIDLSPHISKTDVDYVEFISSYGKKSFLSHEQTDEEDDFKKLNPPRRAYSKGEIEINNEHLESEVDMLESKFAAPITYLNPVFSMSMEKTNLLDLDEEINIPFTGVIDSPSTPGRARFAIDDDVFALADLVRITNSTNANYNGDHYVITLGTGYIELESVAFDTDATGEVAKMNFVYTDSEQVYLLHHVPLYSLTNFSGAPSFQIENTDYETLALGFYNPIATGRNLDTDFLYSMAFESGDMHSVVEKNFSLVAKVLNDPVKLLCVAYLPYKVFLKMDFLRPVTIKTLETSTMYYLNRISGYSGKECNLELIKLP